MTEQDKVLNRLVAARDQVAETMPSMAAILDEGIDAFQNETCICGECTAILENVAALCEVIHRISDKPDIEKNLREALGIPELDPVFDLYDTISKQTYLQT